MAIDYDALFGAEEYDPCAALVALRPAYMKLISGGTLARVTFRDRTTEWHKTDLNEFAALIRQLESECAAKRGRTSSRKAITAGTRTTYGKF
jgi:hypothetical protein